MVKIEYLNLFKEGLTNIYEYFCNTLKNEKAAIDFVKEVETEL